MARVYFDDKGRPQSLPVGQKGGKKYNSALYADHDNTCPECKGYVFYTKNNICAKCAQVRACDLYSYLNGLLEFTYGPDGWQTSYYKVNGFAGVADRLVPDGFKEELDKLALLMYIVPPKSREDAVRRGETLWLTGEPCSKAGHYGIRTLEGDCYFCEEERKKPKPRQEALKAGKKWYTPDTPCLRCNTIAEKRVDNGTCRGCVPEPAPYDTPDVVMMKAQPDLILPKETAVALSMKVYRTGRPCRRGHSGYRYVSTNNCIDCIKER